MNRLYSMNKKDRRSLLWLYIMNKKDYPWLYVKCGFGFAIAAARR